MSERTLVMIKPDAVKKNAIGGIVAHFEKENLKVAGMRMVRLSPAQAETFYSVHRERPFFKDLIAFMTMGPIVAMVLEGKDAVKRVREIMGATDPAKAEANTLRKLYGTNVEKNAVHGSDSPENAEIEINFHFASADLHRDR